MSDAHPPTSAGTGVRERYLTVRWNNVLVGLLGLPALVYAAIVLSTSTLSGRTAFIGMSLIGAVY